MMKSKPVIMVNYKTYNESVGKRGLELTMNIEKYAQGNWVVCPQTIDLRETVKSTELPVFAQHIDAVNPGSHTGHTLFEAAVDAGTVGTLVNHSEHTLELWEIEMLVSKCKDASLTTVVCANNPAAAAAAAAMNPNFVAYEPPELIGGDISVSTAKPELVAEAVRMVNQVNLKVGVLCGAGVKNGEDVKRALELGTEGVLLASGLVKAKDLKATIEELESGLS